MKMLTLATVLCLVLAGCGDDKDPGNPIEDAMRKNNPGGMPMGMPTGMAPGMPGGMPTGLPGPDMLIKTGTVELTDDMMERYVALVEELGSATKMPTAALLARHKFALPQWLALNQIIGGSLARSSMSGIRPKLEKQLADLKAERGTAPEAKQRILDAQIKGLEAQLKALGGIAEASDIDRRNMEVFERWRDRVEAAGR